MCHCSSIYLSQLITEFKIHHLYSLITAHDDSDSVDPRSMQDAPHIIMDIFLRAMSFRSL